MMMVMLVICSNFRAPTRDCCAWHILKDQSCNAARGASRVQRCVIDDLIFSNISVKSMLTLKDVGRENSSSRCDSLVQFAALYCDSCFEPMIYKGASVSGRIQWHGFVAMMTIAEFEMTATHHLLKSLDETCSANDNCSICAATRVCDDDNDDGDDIALICVL